MALASVKDVEALHPHGRKCALNRLDRRAGQRQIVAHTIDVAANAAEIGLHVDDDDRRVLRAQIAIIGPRIGISLNVAFGHDRLSYLVMDSSAGAPTSVRLGEQVTIMISSVRRYGAALNRW